MKKRIDELLVEQGLASSIKEAAAMVMAGEVFLSERRVNKPGDQVAELAEVSLRDKSRYVSRAGDKLDSVINSLDLVFTGKTVLDVGSSTGGFTDVALQHGAAQVIAVDVGNGQLAYKLRKDPRVVSKERTDIRELARAQGQSPTPIMADVAVVDVSFVKLEKILPSVVELIRPGGLIVVLVKPQFEADKATADRFEGVISDEVVRQEIIDNLRSWVQGQFEVLGEADSGVAGTKGNLERFFVLSPIGRTTKH